MPLPLIIVGIDILEPTVRSENVGFPVAIHVCDANAVSVLLFASDMMNLRFSAGEIDPQNSRMVVVRQDEIRFAIAVDVAGRPTLRGFVKSRDILYVLSLDILYSWWRGTGPRNPARDDFRALDSGVQFTNQGSAVEHHHALLDPYHLHPLAR